MHVFLMFMAQFITGCGVFIASLELHEHHHTNAVLVVVGGIAALVGTYFVIAWIGQLVPARCKYCSWPSRYRGLFWWPFIYRYDCKHCGQTMGLEVHG
jgi:hypothetical protein